MQQSMSVHAHVQSNQMEAIVPFLELAVHSEDVCTKSSLKYCCLLVICFEDLLICPT